MTSQLCKGAGMSGAFGRAALALFVLALSLGTALQPVSASSPPEVRWFWVQRASGWTNIRTVVVASTRHLTVYAPAHTVTDHDASRIATTFERRTYWKDTQLFGMPRQFGRISLLLAPLDGITLGYFNEIDLQPSGPDGPYSNHGNIIYVRLPAGMPDKDRIGDVNEVAAHELQHLIQFRIRELDHNLPRQEDWLNEGLSFFAQVANNFFTPRDRLKVQAAANEPGWRVTGLAASNKALLRHGRVAYGRAGLFTTYLAARFGPTFVRNLVIAPRTGMTAVDALLRPRRLCAGQVFADWGVASYINGSGAYGYGWFSKRVRALPRSVQADITTTPYDSESYPGLMADPWSQHYIRFSVRHPGTLHLAIDAPAGHMRVAVVLRGRGSVTPEVRWLHLDTRSQATLDLRDFGRAYSEAVVALSDVAGGTRPDRYRVRAALVDVPDENGVA